MKQKSQPRCPCEACKRETCPTPCYPKLDWMKSMNRHKKGVNHESNRNCEKS